jgi:ClpP class serine protease
MPLWFLIQDSDSFNREHDLCPHVEELFFRARHDLPQGKPVALLIQSPGGSASAAYAIAKMLHRHCGSFVAIVAQWAKSAATLLALGGSEIIIAEHAQLGPLDAQFDDPDREERTSALDETQAVERLHAAAMEALDRAMLMLVRRTGKRVETIMPHAMRFTADLMRPLFEKVDVVQYTNRQRTLKVAEEYAVRLLRPRHPPLQAKQIAQHLVEKYPEHGFMIDYDEARSIGLPVREPTEEQAKHLDKILLHLPGMNAFGRVVET